MRHVRVHGMDARVPSDRVRERRIGIYGIEDTRRDEVDGEAVMDGVVEISRSSLLPWPRDPLEAKGGDLEHEGEIGRAHV